uniref:Uncharacterized protein n=1 Tax=Rhinolophus ferrumequinum TaxID=59479 RepID=A0A671E050_RHIFE
ASSFAAGYSWLSHLISHRNYCVLDSGGIRYVEDKKIGEMDGRCLPGDQKENATQQFKPDE